MTMAHETVYSVEVLRSGQPRPYADTEREYLITIKSTRWGEEGFYPYVAFGDVEDQIKRDEKARAEGTLYGGMKPDDLRKHQRDWALRIVRALCQNFREKGDEDGRTGMDAYFYPTLQSLKIDPVAGTVRAFIIEPFTD